MADIFQLKNNDRVAIIGAGPAGSLFAYSLLRLAKKKKIRLDVTLYDPRDFKRSGPSGCKGCAGVINGNLWQRLHRIGINLRQEKGLICSEVRGYLWNTSSGSIRLDLPQGWEPVRTVYRGKGPAFSESQENISINSFDDFLLNHALALGAQHQLRSVEGVELPHQHGGPVRLKLDDKDQQQHVEAELVVGAFGFNDGMMKIFEDLGIGYQRPLSLRAGQVELVRKAGQQDNSSSGYIQVYNISGPRVRQLVLTPKGQYATLTLLGTENLEAHDLREIRQQKELKAILATGWEWPNRYCACMPLFEKRSGRNFFADRLVLTGDAACCKYFKNGLESALRSSEIAAQTAIDHGVSRESFRRWYFSRVRREIILDNHFGRVLLTIHQYISSHPAILSLMMQIRSLSKRISLIREHDAILWDLLTGNRSYLHIFKRVIKPQLGGAMTFLLTKAIGRRVKINCRLLWRRWRMAKKKSLSKDDGRIFDQEDRSPQKQIRAGLINEKKLRLYSGSRVSIIGGGPAGTSCAITLLHMAKRKNIDLEVTIHEPKDFTTASRIFHPSIKPSHDSRINPCIGVLSPPIHEIMTEKLGIPFPDHLVQKYIIGYMLHTYKETIELTELSGASYAMRRIMFDNYMMEKAVGSGAQWNMAAVTQIERMTKEFKVTTDKDTCIADVVVGAFGVDQQVADIFEKSFGYRRPEYMETVITKRHPSPEFIRQFGLNIHAFLPKLRAVEFGAITPKYNHLSINLAGKHVDTDIMQEFLKLDQVAELLPSQYDEKGSEMNFFGRFPTSPAGNICADNMVIIGDASGMLRPFKGKGINAAILGGIAAGRAMVSGGLSEQDFGRYYLPVFRHITDDLLYARLARFMTNALANRGGMDLVLTLAKESPALRRALTEAVSGASTYHTILQRMTNDRILWRCGADMLRLLTTKKANG